MAESLKNKTVRGVTWSLIDNIANSGITFLVGLILARLLTPAEYGVMAMIAIFIAISTSIIDSGFSNALIRKNEVKKIDYDTVFYFNLVVSGILYIFLYLLSPAISSFFKEPVLIEVTRVISWILIINALGIIPRTIFIINVDFKVQTKASLISSLVSGIVGISMALFGLGVWSLVGQQLSRQLLNTFFLWFYCRWRPAWEFTIYKNIYYIVIGRFYDPDQLGQYTRAEQFKLIFSSNLTAVVQRVSYPVLSSIQSEPVRLREAYRRVIKLTMIVTFACMLGLAAIAKPLIILLIGEKWLPAVPFLQIICFSGMLYPLHAINLNILQVKGRSDLYLKLEIIKKIIAVITIFIGIFWGIECMLWGGVFVSFISFFLNSYYSADLIDYSTKNQISDIFPFLIISLIVSFCIWLISFTEWSYIIILIIQIIVGIGLYWFISEKLPIQEYQEVRQLVFSLFKKK